KFLRKGFAQFVERSSDPRSTNPKLDEAINGDEDDQADGRMGLILRPEGKERFHDSAFLGLTENAEELFLCFEIGRWREKVACDSALLLNQIVQADIESCLRMSSVVEKGIIDVNFPLLTHAMRAIGGL